MVALLQQLSLAEHEDDVCILHRRQAMRDHDHGSTLAGAFKCSLDELLALRVKRAGGLVEEEDLGIPHEGPRNGHALFLPTREGDPTRANVGVVAFRERDDEVVYRSIPAYCVELLVCDLGLVNAKEDVVSDGACGTELALNRPSVYGGFGSPRNSIGS